MFSFKDLLSWNILNALFLFQHFFSKRHEIRDFYAPPSVYFYQYRPCHLCNLSWTWCIFCRLSINTDVFENIFIIIFFYHIKEERIISLPQLSPFALSPLYIVVLDQPHSLLSHEGSAMGISSWLLSNLYFCFFHWPLIVKYIKIFPFWNFKNLTFPSN